MLDLENKYPVVASFQYTSLVFAVRVKPFSLELTIQLVLVYFRNHCLIAMNDKNIFNLSQIIHKDEAHLCGVTRNSVYDINFVNFIFIVCAWIRYW